MLCRHSHVHVQSLKEIRCRYFPVHRHDLVVRLEPFVRQRHDVAVLGYGHPVQGGDGDDYLFHLFVLKDHSFVWLYSTSAHLDEFSVRRHHLPAYRYVVGIPEKRFFGQEQRCLIGRDDFPICRREKDGRELRKVGQRSDVGVRRYNTSVRRRYISVRVSDRYLRSLMAP
ncbi:hypothetical protein [Sphingobacterium chuzhouense]|uniref:Uncharacterized protein n=1 Tax=Sphingobacterium chuzhouense TaxID=1742264 RepID=A0ABR7XPP7_9SPHI|nr:hypothetical protein [Sphingobacterium chuzhouense]MBD1421150.1 hypothetical protein [Sphingobacterium chuzhouense]